MTQQPTNQTSATHTSHAVEIVTQFYEAYGKEDLDGMRAVMDPTIVWRIPGRHSLSGSHQGIEETIFFFQQLTKAQFKAEVYALVGNDEYAVDYHRGWGSFGEHSLDVLWAIVWRVRDGKIVEGIDFAFDQAAADIFYSAVYPLKPLSQRLAE